MTDPDRDHIMVRMASLNEEITTLCYVFRDACDLSRAAHESLAVAQLRSAKLLERSTKMSDEAVDRLLALRRELSRLRRHVSLGFDPGPDWAPDDADDDDADECWSAEPDDDESDDDD